MKLTGPNPRTPFPDPPPLAQLNPTTQPRAVNQTGPGHERVCVCGSRWISESELYWSQMRPRRCTSLIRSIWPARPCDPSTSAGLETLTSWPAALGFQITPFMSLNMGMFEDGTRHPWTDAWDQFITRFDYGSLMCHWVSDHEPALLFLLALVFHAIDELINIMFFWGVLKNSQEVFLYQGKICYLCRIE